MSTIGDRILFLASSQDITQAHLADSIQISKQSLYKYTHNLCEPRSEIIRRLAVVLNTTADFLVGLTADPLPSKRNEKEQLRLQEEFSLLEKYRQLSYENKIKITERINIYLEK